MIILESEHESTWCVSGGVACFWSAGFACFWNVRFALCWSGLWPSGAQAWPAAGAFALLTAGAAFGLLERRPCLLLERSLRSLLEWAIGILEAAKRRSVKLSFLQKRQSRAPAESEANAPEGQRPLQQGAKRLLPSKRNQHPIFSSPN
ncbi:hypothetical protein SAMN02745866_02401 [Alteromonadaceae bacterium Bs31]|nr:hypothetical protein SAMN02745866_02401 [Alteromonadaceae bacterium Bs31]